MPRCKDCNVERPRDELSKRGLCPECGSDRMLDANHQMKAKAGPVYERQQSGLKLWRARYEHLKAAMKRDRDRAGV